MRIVTWNCGGALRRKWHLLEPLHADVMVIQECEDPGRAKDPAYAEWADRCVWVGPTKNKGIGVFVRQGVTVQPLVLDLGPLELFLPCLLNGELPLLAVWTRQANSPTFGYIGQLWKFLQLHRDFLMHPKALLVGDLNSNARWDVWDRWWNHSDVVRDLAGCGLRSAYHDHHGVPQGAESHATFYLQRNRQKAYHIDYVFAADKWATRSAELGCPEVWLQYSDHMPLVVDLEDQGEPSDT